MNVEIGSVAALFLFWEYVFSNFRYWYFFSLCKLPVHNHQTFSHTSAQLYKSLGFLALYNSSNFHFFRPNKTRKKRGGGLIAKWVRICEKEMKTFEGK